MTNISAEEILGEIDIPAAKIKTLPPVLVPIKKAVPALASPSIVHTKPATEVKPPFGFGVRRLADSWPFPHSLSPDTGLVRNITPDSMLYELSPPETKKEIKARRKQEAVEEAEANQGFPSPVNLQAQIFAH